MPPLRGTCLWLEEDLASGLNSADFAQCDLGLVMSPTSFHIVICMLEMTVLMPREVTNTRRRPAHVQEYGRCSLSVNKKVIIKIQLLLRVSPDCFHPTLMTWLPQNLLSCPVSWTMHRAHPSYWHPHHHCLVVTWLSWAGHALTIGRCLA